MFFYINVIPRGVPKACESLVGRGAPVHRQPHRACLRHLKPRNKLAVHYLQCPAVVVFCQLAFTATMARAHNRREPAHRAAPPSCGDNSS